MEQTYSYIHILDENMCYHVLIGSSLVFPEGIWSGTRHLLRQYGRERAEINKSIQDTILYYHSRFVTIVLTYRP